MTTNKSQYTITTQWIIPEDKKSEVESFFAEHEVWMRETHNLSGNDEPRNPRSPNLEINSKGKVPFS